MEHACKYMEQMTELLVRMEAVREDLQAGELRFTKIEESFDKKVEILREEIVSLRMYQQQINVVIKLFAWIVGTLTAVMSSSTIMEFFTRSR